MGVADLGDPCLPHADDIQLSSDQTTAHMKELYLLGKEAFGEKYVEKKEIYELLRGVPEKELFSWWDMNERSGQTAFGKLLSRFVNRELGGITLTIQKSNKNNVTYRFALR